MGRLDMSTTCNRYLEGGFGPVAEEVTVTDLPITGSLPAELDGRYLRNGPNPIAAVDPAIYHWFLGTAMVHGLRLRDGKAEWYRNRWVRSADVAEALGEPRWPGPIHAGFDFSPNTNVIGHAGRTFAVVEAGPRPYELTDELDTVGPCDLDGTLPGGYTAHPHVDPGTGELHAVSYFFGWGRTVQYSVIDRDGRVRRTVDIDVGGSPMMHDFSLTRDHVVLYDLPVTFDIGTAARGAPRLLRRPAAAVSRVIGRRNIPERVVGAMLRAPGANGAFPYAWDERRPARVGVLPREGGSDDVRWFEVDPCYVFHPLNAYEDGPDRIVLDVVRHPKMFATDHNGPNEGTPTLDRWIVDLRAGKVLEERLDDRGQEFPRIDERRTGHRHRYGYAPAVGSPAGDLDVQDGLLKHDLVAGTTQVRTFPGGGVGEFAFVPRRPDSAEDDGYLMGFVHEKAEDRTDLAVLDAGTLETVAAVHLPVRVPYGFHGNWVPAAAT
jgi:carotenoid cleavage oxygenase